MLNTKDNILRFIRAPHGRGYALFTLHNSKTGNHVTFKVKRKKDYDFYFVSFLCGPDNNSDYRYLGCIMGSEGHQKFRTTGASPSDESRSVKVMDWFFNDILQTSKPIPSCVSFKHEGKCGRCAKTLTVPESIDSGFGPVCMQKVA